MRYSLNKPISKPWLSLIYMSLSLIMTNVATGETIRINGSGTCLDVMKPLIESYSKSNPGISFAMEKPLGSSGAVKAVLAGALDIAVSSKPLKPEEVTQGAIIRSFGKTPLALIVGKNVPVKNISTAELEKIYYGETRKWQNGENIRVVLRPLEDIDTKILRGLSRGMDLAITQAQSRPGMMTAVTDPESNELVIKTPGSIGASGLASIVAQKLPVTVLRLNGIMPSTGAVAEGKYPLVKEMSFVTTTRISAAAAKFLEFIYSAKGRAVVQNIEVLVTAGDNVAK